MTTIIIILAVIFSMIGILSTLIGLGGGTFYLIFMDLFNVPVYAIPILALLSNIVISGIGSVARLMRKERYSIHFLIKILIPSMIMAYMGARLQIEEQTYRLLLNIILLVIILIRFILQRKIEIHNVERLESSGNNISFVKLFIISGIVGFISGLIGIGGGIILGPILYFYGMSYKKIPLITTMYIFFNSIIGLFAHLQKNHWWGAENISDSLAEFFPYLILPLVSIVTGIISMKLLAFRMNSTKIKYAVMITISAISIYNVMRLGGLYG